MEVKKILASPLTELDLSESFCKSCLAMDFNTLEDIIFILPEELMRKQGFSYTWLGELSEYLDKHELLYLLQPISGKNYG